MDPKTETRVVPRAELVEVLERAMHAVKGSRTGNQQLGHALAALLNQIAVVLREVNRAAVRGEESRERQRAEQCG